jgi:hypothetical protein
MTIVKLERIGSTGTFVRGPLTARVGETVEYEIVVSNTGNTSLKVMLSDPMCDAGTLAPSGIQSVAVGATATYFCSHLLVKDNAGTFANVATATGTSPSGTSVGPVASRVIVKVGASGVLGAKKVIVHKKQAAPTKVRTVTKVKVITKVVHVKAVTTVAKAAKPVVKSAAFTG